MDAPQFVKEKLSSWGTFLDVNFRRNRRERRECAAFEFYDNVMEKLNHIESMLDYSINLFKQEGKTLMDNLSDLKNAVADIATDVQNDATEIGVTVDLLKQMVQSPTVDPALKETVDALVAAHAGFQSNVNTLKATVDKINVSGGVVTPPVPPVQ